MKKKLEAELISIAHRILKLKGKSDVVQLHQETQKLYEKLSVLRFVEENFAEVKPTIGRPEIEEVLETAFDATPEVSVEVPSESVPEITAEFTPIAVFMPEEVSEDRGFEDEETTGAIIEDEKEEVISVENQEKEPETDEAEVEIEPVPEVEMPHIPEIGEEEQTEEEEEELETEPEEDEAEMILNRVLPIKETVEEYENETEEKPETEPEVEPEDETEEEPAQEEVKPTPKEISFADLLGHDFSEPIFERVEDIKSSVVETPVFEKAPVEFRTESEDSEEDPEEEVYFKADEPKAEYQYYDAHAKSITFGLNDKIGFEKHLFGGSSEDMNRVVSQLSTYGTFEEARDFIEDMVKPDYNNWEGKDDYVERFMEIVERSFA